MGNTASSINWNPGDSTLGRTLTGQSGSALKDPNVWNPQQSTLGAFTRGDYGNALNQTAGGLGNAANLSKDLGAGLLNPVGGVSDIYGSATGQPQAAQRRQKDVLGQTAANDERFAQEQQASQMAQQQAEAKKAQEDKLASYGLQQQAISDEDAFVKARNAARRAKGSSLFGAWG